MSHQLRYYYQIVEMYDDNMLIKPKINISKSIEVIQARVSSLELTSQCGNFNTVFLTNGGEVYVCGDGREGQLGNEGLDEEESEDEN